MRLAVGSVREVKLEAVRRGATRLAIAPEVVGYDVESYVSRQPRSLGEILTGARNRAVGALAVDRQAELGFGLEAGVIEAGGRGIDFGCVYVAGRTGIWGVAFSPGVALPAAVERGIRGGHELSEVVSEVYGTATLADRDCSAIITDGFLPGVEFYRPAVSLAVIDYERSLAQSAAD